MLLIFLLNYFLTSKINKLIAFGWLFFKCLNPTAKQSIKKGCLYCKLHLRGVYRNLCRGRSSKLVEAWKPP